MPQQGALASAPWNCARSSLLTHHCLQVPRHGMFEFDYVSTTRPEGQAVVNLSKGQFLRFCRYVKLIQKSQERRPPPPVQPGHSILHLQFGRALRFHKMGVARRAASKAGRRSRPMFLCVRTRVADAGCLPRSTCVCTCLTGVAVRVLLWCVGGWRSFSHLLWMSLGARRQRLMPTTLGFAPWSSTQRQPRRGNPRRRCIVDRPPHHCYCHKLPTTAP